MWYHRENAALHLISLPPLPIALHESFSSSVRPQVELISDTHTVLDLSSHIPSQDLYVDVRNSNVVVGGSVVSGVDGTILQELLSAPTHGR